MHEGRGQFFVHRKILRMVGLSLEGTEKWNYKLYQAIIFGSIASYVLLLVLDILNNFENIDKLTDAVYHAVCFASVLMKFSLMSSNRGKLDKTLEMLQKGVFAPNPNRGGPNEKTWVEYCVKNTNKLIIISCIAPIIATVLALSASMVHRIITKNPLEWQLPFGEFSTLKPSLSPNFELGWLFQMVVFPLSAIIYLATDFLIVGVFSHISLQFKMLRNSIESMVPDGEDYDTCFVNSAKYIEYTTASIWETLALKVKANVLYYMAILDVASKFENMFNMIVFWNYLVVLVAVACAMYHGSLYSPLDPRSQKDLTLVVAIFFQVFLTSYFGNQVTAQSGLVLSACYEVDFIGRDLRFQKSLCILMARSQKPVAFTIGKFSNISLILFVTMARTCVSYYMVLVSVNKST